MAVRIAATIGLNGDGDYEDTHFETTPQGVKKHTWVLDHLEPGATYHAMVAATDEHGHTSYAWGEFTTLSQRDVFVEFGDLTITGGPNNITATMWRLGLDGPQEDVTPGQQGILLYKDLPWIADPDTKPAGKTRWTSTTAQTTLRPPTAEGDALPPGHGDPYWFNFEVPVTLHVSYS